MLIIVDFVGFNFQLHFFVAVFICFDFFSHFLNFSYLQYFQYILMLLGTVILLLKVLFSNFLENLMYFCYFLVFSGCFLWFSYFKYSDLVAKAYSRGCLNIFRIVITCSAQVLLLYSWVACILYSIHAVPVQQCS